MHQLNRAMSKIISVEDDLVSNDELNPEAQIEKNEVETTIVRPQFSVDIKKHWNKRWKFVSCCLGVQCVIFLIVICVLATQYVNVKRKIRIMSKRNLPHHPGPLRRRHCESRLLAEPNMQANEAIREFLRHTTHDKRRTTDDGRRTTSARRPTTND